MNRPGPGQLPWRLLFSRLPVDPDLEGAPAVPPLGRPAVLAAVAAGGVAGSAARAWVAVALPHDPSQWPWSTVAVNLSGSALLACLLGTLIERWPRARLPQPLFGAGLLGGFTTFSTFSVDGFQLARHGRPLLALLYVVVSVAGGGACATAGLALARAADRLSDHQRWHRRAQLHLSSPQASPGPPTPEAGP